MKTTLREVAEVRFAALTRREASAMTEVETERHEMQQKTARLKALRLASEAATLASKVAGLTKRRLVTVS